MKSKIVTTLLVIGVLSFCAYAQVEVCNTTAQQPCIKAGKDLTACGNGNYFGIVWADGPNMDTCQINPPYAGANGCADESKIDCYTTCNNYSCDGTYTHESLGPTHPTPTYANGPCQ